MQSRALAGQIALITGGARGIGAATANSLAAAGAHVVLADILDSSAAAEAIQAAGGSAEACALDIREREACAELAADLRSRHGRLDTLICNAGVCPRGQVVGDWEQWQWVMDVNLTGTQNCVAAVWDGMVEQHRGIIVLLSSMAYYQGGVMVGSEYTASKAAIVGLTRHLARNGGPHGIRCNAVAPGMIVTDMLDDFDTPDPETIPLRRLGTAEDCAGPIRFLCGPESSYMTGTVLNVTGGMILSA
ncbi:MAG: SDR family NAD(P)-dependent oxidoreductase [Gammaproteobacteria bacterium]